MSLRPRLLPDRLFARALLARLVFLWIPVRAGQFVVEVSVHERGDPPPSLFVTPLSAAGIAVLVALLQLLDVRRRGEHVLLANLGTGTRELLLLSAVATALLELAVALFGAATRQGVP